MASRLDLVQVQGLLDVRLAIVVAVTLQRKNAHELYSILSVYVLASGPESILTTLLVKKRNANERLFVDRWIHILCIL